MARLKRGYDCKAECRLYAYCMSSSFHSADRRTYRKVLLVGMMFCVLFVAVSFLAREQPQHTYVLQKADRLMRTAGAPLRAN